MNNKDFVGRRTITNDLYNSFFDKKDFSDLILKFGTTELYLHKIILSEFSEYFESLFRFTPQIKELILPTSNKKEEEMYYQIIKFCYGYEIFIPPQSFFGFYDCYDFLGIKQKCWSIIPYLFPSEKFSYDIDLFITTLCSKVYWKDFEKEILCGIYYNSEGEPYIFILKSENMNEGKNSDTWLEKIYGKTFWCDFCGKNSLCFPKMCHECILGNKDVKFENENWVLKAKKTILRVLYNYWEQRNYGTFSKLIRYPDK